MRKLLTVIITVGLLATGCQSGNEATEKKESSQPMPLSNTDDDISQLPSKQAEEILQKKNHLKDIKAVNDEKKVLIAAQIPHNERFQIDKIEETMTKQAEKQFPGHDVTLSLDLKINLETEDLKQRIANRKISKKKLSEEIDRIIKLSKRKP